jgi:hypothetical protein
VCGAPIYASKFAAKKFYCSPACKQRVYYGRHTEKSKAASIKWAQHNRERSNEIKRRSRMRKRFTQQWLDAVETAESSRMSKAVNKAACQ